MQADARQGATTKEGKNAISGVLCLFVHMCMVTRCIRCSARPPSYRRMGGGFWPVRAIMAAGARYKSAGRQAQGGDRTMSKSAPFPWAFLGALVRTVQPAYCRSCTSSSAAFQTLHERPLPHPSHQSASRTAAPPPPAGRSPGRWQCLGTARRLVRGTAGPQMGCGSGCWRSCGGWRAGRGWNEAGTELELW